MQARLLSQRGFTIFELMTASFMSLLIMAMALASSSSLRDIYSHEIVRTRMNQDLRGAMDLIGANIRQAGENFTVGFPALQVTNGSSGASDELYMRRNLLDEVLSVCTAITAGSAKANIIFANTSGTAGCDRASNTQNYTSWRNYRIADDDGSVRAYIFNRSTKLGEYFNYVSELDTGTGYYVSTDNSGTWSNAYPVGSSAVYIMEEWRFRRQADVLELLVDGDTASPLNVAFGLTDFQVQVLMDDGTTKTSFTTSDDWTAIQAVDVEIDGQDSFRARDLTGALRSRFFPRNVLSN